MTTPKNVDVAYFYTPPPWRSPRLMYDAGMRLPEVPQQRDSFGPPMHTSFQDAMRALRASATEFEESYEEDSS